MAHKKVYYMHVTVSIILIIINYNYCYILLHLPLFAFELSIKNGSVFTVDSVSTQTP